jgi:hypothetical protein
MLEVYTYLVQLWTRRRNGEDVPLVDYVTAVRMLAELAEQLLSNRVPFGDASTGDLITLLGEIHEETTGQPLSVPVEGGGQLVSIILLILKLLAEAKK